MNDVNKEAVQLIFMLHQYDRKNIWQGHKSHSEIIRNYFEIFELWSNAFSFI